MADREQVKMTAEEYRQLPETSQRMELINGEIVVAPAPKHIHQKIVLRIANFLLAHAPDKETVISLSDVHLDRVNALQPDVFWVSDDNPNCKLGDDDYWHGAPDLIVEVLFPSTEARDRETKFHIYQEHGVKELWLVQTATPFVEVFARQGDTLVRMGLFELAATFTSPALGNTIIDVKSLLGR